MIALLYTQATFRCERS